MYLGNKNLQLSLIIAIAFCLTVSLVNSQMAAERFEDMAHENFVNMAMNEGFYENLEHSKDKEPAKDKEPTLDKESTKKPEAFMNEPPIQQLSYLENSVRQVTDQYKRV